MNLISGPKNSPKFELDQVIILKIIQVSLFFQPKKRRDTLETKGCYGNILLQWLLTKYVKCPSKV